MPSKRQDLNFMKSIMVSANSLHLLLATASCIMDASSKWCKGITMDIMKFDAKRMEMNTLF